MIKNLIYKAPILFPGLITTFIFILTLSIYISPNYNSESVISVSSNESNTASSALGIVSSFLGSGIDQSIGDLKAYLESDIASEDLKKMINIDEIYTKSTIDFFSRYRASSKKDLKDYLKKRIVLKADTSGNLIINTFAFQPDDALRVNLAVIMLASNYFDKRQTLNSKLAMHKHMCQYELSKDGFPEIDINKILEPEKIEFNANIDVNQFMSANKMLLTKAYKYKSFCKPSLRSSEENSIGMPEKTLRDLNSATVEELIGNIYLNSISTMTMSDAIEILAEPTINTKSEDKKIILYSIIVFIFSILVFTTVRILFKLRDDFKF